MKPDCSSGSYGAILGATSFGLGTLLTAALLHQHPRNPVTRQLLGFGDWLASIGGVSGFWPALLVVSALLGLMLFCFAAAVTPFLEELIARKGMERSRRAVGKGSEISVEDEMHALVKKFGRKKPLP